jgi:hypothetical protein
MYSTSHIRVDMLTTGLISIGSMVALINGHTTYMDVLLEPNKKLENYVYNSTRAISTLECVDHCSQDDRCMSFNFNKKIGNGGLCELNNGTKRNASLTEATGYIYGEDKSNTKDKQVRTYHL